MKPKDERMLYFETVVAVLKSRTKILNLKTRPASAIVRRRIIFVCLSENGDCIERISNV